MADPLSIAAIIGLVFAGRKLSEKDETQPKPPVQLAQPRYESMSMVTNSMAGSYNPDPGLSSYGVTRQQKVEQPNFADIKPDSGRNVYGSPAVASRTCCRLNSSGSGSVVLPLRSGSRPGR